MRRLRVLYLIDQVIDTGGAERFALGLATHLPADRFELWVCSTRGAEPAALEQLRVAGVRHVDLGRRSKLDVWRFGRLVALIRRQRFDIVHGHMFGSNLWGCLIGRACRVPIVIAHEQTWSYEGEPLRRWLDGHVIGRLATRFIAVSTRDAERMVTIEGVPAHKIVTIPNAYVPRPGSSDTDLRAELHLRPRTPLVVVVAQLRPRRPWRCSSTPFPASVRPSPRRIWPSPAMVSAGRHSRHSPARWD